ncbi:MAG TPA: hypothetical protein PLG73_12945, partial [Candidatus Sumerlaeota bacterium]|nr:hypothetical protein [Candidatus Sumerlaeota bacterium]
PGFIARIAAGDNAASARLDNLLDDPRVHEFLLSHPARLERLLRDPRTQERIVHLPDVLEALLAHERTVSRLLAHGELLDRLAGDDGLLQRVLQRDAALDRLLGEERLIARLLAHPVALGAILAHPATLESIRENPILLGRLLRHDDVLQFITGDPRLVGRLLQSEFVVARLLSARDTLPVLASALQAHGGSPLLADLAADDEILARRLLGDPRFLERILRDDRLCTLIIMERLVLDDRLLDRLPIDERLLQKLLARDSVVERILADRRVQERMADDPRLLSHRPGADAPQPRADQLRLLADPSSPIAVQLEFDRLWELLRPHARADRVTDERLAEARSRLRPGDDPARALLEVIRADGVLRLRQGDLAIPDDEDPWPPLVATLIARAWDFDADTDAPVVLDVGAGHGLAIYHDKSRFPNARIIAFEPDPRRHALAVENARRLQWRDVEIHPFLPTGGRTGARKRDRAPDHRRLSHYLRGPVHLLRLRVPAGEADLLRDARRRLGLVRAVIVELRLAPGESGNRLRKVLNVLSKAGFEVRVGQPVAAQRLDPAAALHVAGGDVTRVYARNRRPVAGLSAAD